MYAVYILLIFLSATFAVKTPASEDFYHAAVVEYHSIEAGLKSLEKNVDEYVSIINKAANQADIIIFPEVGLLLGDHYQTFIEINDTIAPVDDDSAHPALQTISKSARVNEVYVAINIHEKNITKKETFHYNTNVVFNRTGHIIARYRKFHLFDEPLNVTKTPEIVYFDSDFGVRFGTFTCFDILFEEPALSLTRNLNVTDIIYPTFWYSSLPFFSAIETQAGWAYATDMNLLASGGNHPSGSNSGSGIYAGKRGPVVSTLSQRELTAILYAKIFKRGREGNSTGSIDIISKSNTVEGLTLWKDPVLKMIQGEVITPTKFDKNIFKNKTDPEGNPLFYAELSLDKNICHGSFCCHFKSNVTLYFKSLTANTTAANSSNPYFYRFAVFDGVTLFNVFPAGVQFCAVISCLNETADSCGSYLPNPDAELLVLNNTGFGDLFLYSTEFKDLTVSTSNLDGDGFAYPFVLELNKNLNELGSLVDVSRFSYAKNSNNSVLRLSSEKLVTGAIYGRVFSRDQINSSPRSSPLLFPTILSVFLLYILYNCNSVI